MATKQQVVEEAMREMLSKVSSGELYGTGDDMDVSPFLDDLDALREEIEIDHG